MGARSKLGVGGAVLAFAGIAVACTAGSGPLPTPGSLGYEKPGTPFEPSGGQEQPAPVYQVPAGQTGGGGGGGGGGGCSYCGKTYTCSYTADGFTGSSQTTLPPSNGGNSCGISDDAGTATFSCNGTISFNGTTATWTASAGGGFSYTVSSSNPGGNGGTTSVTIDCVPSDQQSAGSSSGTVVGTPVSAVDAG